MAGETYANVTPPTGSTFIAGHAARASQIERVRQNFVVLGRRRYFDLGGTESDGHTDTSYARLRNGREVELCEEDFRGLTLTMRVWVRVANVAGSVRVRLRNTTDSVTVAEMASAVTDITLTLYEVAVTLPAGTTPKTCRLEIIAGSATYPAFAFGQLRIVL